MSNGRAAAGALVWGAGWNTAGLLGAAGFNFAATLIVTRSLGVDAYAQYSYLLWLASVGSLAASVGLARPIARFVARARGEANPGWANALVRRSCILVAALGVALGPALALVARHLHPGLVFVPTPLLTACILCGGVAAIQTAALQGGMGFRGFAFANVLSAGALCVATVVVALRRGTAEHQFAAAVFSVVVMVVLQGMLLARRAGREGAHAGAGESFLVPREFREYWLSAGGLMLIEAIVWQRPEVLFLASYASPEQLSYYSAAWALSSRFMLIATFLAPVLQAQVAGMRYSNEATRMQALYRHSSRWLCLIATPAFLLPAGVAPSLARLLYGPDFEPAALTLSILLLGALVSTVSVAGSAIVYGTDRMAFALRWGAVAAVMTLTLNGLLIPSFGAPGAAIANVAGQFVAIAATLALSLAPSGFRFPWGVSVRTLAAGFVAALAAGLVEGWLGGGVGLLAAVAVGLLTYLGAVLVLGVLRPDDWTLVNLLAPKLSRRSASFRALLTWALGPVPGDRP